ncbi:hypothetical protein ACERII_22825 [Evansella sp. AB-rgal1]|uniref:hypothetical protein n=1 Tax=Evansella sp. AB-rgal1 TaxID=3242696 RepID=UPI00359ECC4B
MPETVEGDKNEFLFDYSFISCRFIFYFIIIFRFVDYMWFTNEPVIVYLLILIFTHLLLQSIGKIKKESK